MCIMVWSYFWLSELSEICSPAKPGMNAKFQSNAFPAGQSVNTSCHSQKPHGTGSVIWKENKSISSEALKTNELASFSTEASPHGRLSTGRFQRIFSVPPHFSASSPFPSGKSLHWSDSSKQSICTVSFIAFSRAVTLYAVLKGVLSLCGRPSSGNSPHVVCSTHKFSLNMLYILERRKPKFGLNSPDFFNKRDSHHVKYIGCRGK